MHTGYWWESQKERDHWEDPRRRWVNNIKMDLREIGWDEVDWIDMAQGPTSDVSHLISVPLGFPGPS
jgi:hypothetical protein